MTLIQKLFVTRVCSREREMDSTNVTVVKKLKETYGISITTLYSIQELFPLFSNPKYFADIIAIDIDYFYSCPGTNPFELVQTLDTLIKCTVYRPEPDTESTSIKPLKRNTKIIVLADENQDPDLVKEVYACPAISGLTLRCLDDTDERRAEVAKSLYALKDGSRVVSKKLSHLLKKSSIKPPKTKKEIELTPRQNQIYKIVSERGVSNKVIAKMLNLSESTIKLHISQIFKKFGVKNRTQLAVYAKTQPASNDLSLSNNKQDLKILEAVVDSLKKNVLSQTEVGSIRGFSIFSSQGQRMEKVEFDDVGTSPIAFMQTSKLSPL